MAGNDHEGSAWLIDAEHALTALHCVQTSDGVLRQDLSLVFYGQETKFLANVEAVEKRIDVALLKLAVPHPMPADFVVSLSRSSVSQHDVLELHGHPAAGSSSPAGITVPCKVLNPVHPFCGTSGKLDFNAIAIHPESITPGQVAGKASSGLKGASGGALAWNVSNEAHAAVGLLLEEGMSGNHLYAVSITEIAKYFPPVAAALAGSAHVDQRVPRILLELAGTGRVRWSGAVPPGDVDQLWTIGTGPSKPWQLYSAAKLRELGPVAKALVRLAAYARVHSLGVPDKDAWEHELSALHELHRAPDTSLVLHGEVASGVEPAEWQEHDARDLAVLLHGALNRKLLSMLSDELYCCLATGKYSGIGVKIEKNLRMDMWQQWMAWQVQLESCPDLLRHFLGRVFDVNAEAKVSEDGLASIGCCAKLREQLFRATLLAVALGAAGIPTAPALHSTGNLQVTERIGHACGVETRDQTDLRMFAHSVQWKSDVVFLPYLQSPLLQLYEKSVSFTKAEGTLNQAIAMLPPIAVTLEPAFLTALAGGASHVCSFYNALDDERNQRLAATPLAGRMDKLNA
jgi:hypothetical protein